MLQINLKPSLDFLQTFGSSQKFRKC